MKFRSLYKFSNLENKDNFVFFAQLLEEMLFDYTLDTYKPSILNIHSLINESLNVISEVENGNIKKPNISHVIDELVNNFEKDIIANKLIQLPKEEIISILKNKTEHNNYGKIKNILEIIDSSLNPRNYKEMLQLEIITALKQEHKNFRIIRTLARSYITFLISNGYNTRYIRKEVLNFFWEDDEKFKQIEDVQKLFDIFSFDYKNYNIFFSADNMLSIYQSPNNDDKLIYVYQKDELPDLIQDRNFLKVSPGNIFYLMKHRALDPFSAREFTEKSLRLFSNLINIFHHKKEINWQKRFIVIDTESNKSTIVDEPIKSMQKCVDLKEQKAKSKLQDFLFSFYLEDNSFKKFINSVRLHSMAIHTSSHENQLLNLWVALESLIPEDTKTGDESNIEHIINSVIPFLNMYYFRSLIEKLVKDLVRWDVNLFRRILRNIDGNDFISKIINLLSNELHNEKLNDLMSKTRDFHLINDRLEYFKNLFSSKKSMKEAISNHTKRLEWQIRRIYRTRNLIVHTGVTPNYTSILIEHTHGYLDILLLTLIQLSSLNRINSVGQGFQYMDILYKDYLKILDINRNSVLTDSDIEKIFGYLN